MEDAERVVILVEGGRGAARSLRVHASAIPIPPRWIYLGTDVARARALERELGDDWERVPLASTLRRVAQDLRDPFIEYMADLGERVGFGEAWWRGKVSERNILVSDLFLKVCCLRCGHDLCAAPGIEQRIGAIVVEWASVAEELAAALDRGGVRVVQVRRQKPWRVQIRHRLRRIAGRIYFIFCYSKHIIATRRRLRRVRDRFRGPGTVPLTLVWTWVGASNFIGSTSFRDGYFGGLTTELRRRGVEAVTVPLMAVPPQKAGQVIERLTGVGGAWLAPEEFLKVTDVLGAAWRSLREPIWPQLSEPLAGMSIEAILRDERLRDRSSNRGAKALLYTRCFINRLDRAGVAMERIIWPFENHSWEKLLCIYSKDRFPSVKLVGYQHASVPEMLMNYCVARKEAGSMPLPDIVATNGAYTARLLSGWGYLDGSVLVAGALRYPEVLRWLASPPSTPPPDPTAKPIVLLAGSSDPNDTIELVCKSASALAGRDDIHLVLKCHPMTPVEVLQSQTTAGLFDGVEVSHRPIAEILESSTVMLYTSSTSSLEAMARGVPVVHVESDHGLSLLDPLDHDPGLRPRATTEQELRSAVDHLLRAGPPTDEQRALWRAAVQEMFAPVSERTCEVFLA